MGLNSLGSCRFIRIINILKEFWQYDIVGIKNHGNVVDLELRKIVNGILQCLSFGTLFEIRCKKSDGILCQFEIGHFFLMVRDNDNVKKALRIHLS